METNIILDREAGNKLSMAPDSCE